MWKKSVRLNQIVLSNFCQKTSHQNIENTAKIKSKYDNKIGELFSN